MATEAGQGRGVGSEPPGTTATDDGGANGRSDDGRWSWPRRRVALVCVAAFLAAVPIALVALWLTRQFSLSDLLQLLTALGTVLATLYAVVAWVRDWAWQADQAQQRRRANPPWSFTVGLVALVSVSVVLATVVVVGVGDLVGSDEPGQVRVAGDDCGRPVADDAIEVMTVWDDRAELRAFCAVVGEYTPDDDRDVEVASVGIDVGARLEHRLDQGSPPDVAILPQPSLVRAFGSQGALLPLEDDVAERFPIEWNAFVTEQEAGRGSPQVFGAFVKGAHKSLFWYRPDGLGNAAGVEPEDWTWSDFTRWIGDQLADDSGPAPLTLAAGDRWSLTDWFENQLAGNAPDVYGDLARGQQADGEPIDWNTVRVAWDEAFTQIADLWETPSLFTPGAGGTDVRDTHWQQLPDLVYDGDAQVMFGPSFLAGPVDEGQRGDLRLYPFGFPTLPAGRPLVVGGDVAVVPRDGHDPIAAQAFVRWLTDADAIRLWSEADRGYLTPNVGSPHLQEQLGPPDNEDNVRVYLTYQMRHPEGDLHFDLSDDQLSVANQDDPHHNWQVFARFFDDVTTGQISRRCAVDRAVARLEAEYRGEEWPEAVCTG